MRGRLIARLAGESWPAIVVWSAATASILATCTASGYRPFVPDTWARWDSALYLDIARHGYTLFQCAPPHRSDWCGNAGWFPAYPALAAALHAVGLPLGGAALALSWLFGAATIALLWFTFLGRRLSLAALACLAYVAFAPGQVYDYAIFPLSLLTFWVVAHLWLLVRGRWARAGLAGALAASAYPVGVMVVPAAVLWLLAITRAEPTRERIRRITLVGGLSLLGPAIVVVSQALEVGRWNAYFLVQAKYGHGLRDPVAPAIDAARTLSHSSPFAVANAPAVQTLLVAFVLACVLVELLARRRTATRLDVLVALWAIFSWLLPHLQENVSIYRSQAALAPLALLVRRLPLPLLAPIVGVAIWLSVPMAQLYLRAQLV